MIFSVRLASILALFLMVLPALADAPPAENAGLPLLFSDDFEHGSEHWEMTDPAAWKVLEENGGHVLALTGDSKYNPPVRSPKSIARIKDLTAGDFIFEAQVKQTSREYGHRDACLFFGYQDPTHYYYVHLATAADEHANSIFLVKGEPRVSIAKERTQGTKWDDKYHKIVVKRDAAAGKIEVFFDDMTKPVMVAEDKTFTSGGFGVGSFDDTEHFDNIRIWGKKTEGAAK